MADHASLAQAREVFRRGYADLIQKGRSIKIATDTRPGTVADLFEGYIDNLKETGESSWREGLEPRCRHASGGTALPATVRQS
jgi:hypothetical protein